jgi:perosamine synthetase
MNYIPIYKPYLPKGSLDYAHKALDSTWISSQGEYINKTTEKLQELLGVKYVQLLNNGTSACHLMAKAVIRKHKINEIIVPNNVYVAAWNGFLFDNNWTIKAIDADLDTWNFDLNKLDIAIKDNPYAAVLIVHNIGNIINVPALKLKYPNTIFVEDACEALFGSYEGKQAGTESFCSAISFFGNKSITSGEGGAFLTNDEAIFNYIKCVQGQGQSDQRFIHNELGYNYRITNIQAAILLGQIEILPTILDMKNEVFTTYRTALKDREDIFMQKIEENTTHSNWMFGIRAPNHKGYKEAEAFFKKNNIEIRPMFYAIDEHKYLNNNSKVHWNDCTNADILNKECFILPSYPELTKDEQKHILKTLDDYLIP